MPPLSQLMQMAPGNVFGGLGKGLGAAIGGGISKQIQRPLFNRLAEKYVQSKQAPEETALMSSMGLTEAPVEGAPQYEEFYRQLNAAMAQPRARAATAMELWEQSPEEARKYLLAEEAAKKQGKVTKFDRMQDPKAKMVYAQLRAMDKKMEEVQQSGLPYAERQKAMGALQLQKQGLVRDYETLTGTKLSEPSITQMAELINKEVTAQNIQKQVAGKDDAAIESIYKTLPESAKTLRSRISKAVDTLTKLRSSQGIVAQEAENFDPDNVSSVDQATAIKELGLAIEPGLQVTEGEVQMFAGQSWAQKILKEIQSLRDSAKTIFGEGGSLDKSAGEAGWSNAQLTREALIKASEIIGASQRTLQEFVLNAARNTISSAEQTIKDKIARNQTLSAEQKASLKPQVEDKILKEAVPMGLVTYEPMAPLTMADFKAVADKPADPPADGGGEERDTDSTIYGDKKSQTDVNSAITDFAQGAAANAANGVQFKNIPKGGFN